MSAELTLSMKLEKVVPAIFGLFGLLLSVYSFYIVFEPGAKFSWTSPWTFGFVFGFQMAYSSFKSAFGKSE